ILASMEPVLSSIFAFFIFGEVLNGKQIVGAILIIIAAIILELKLDKERINNVFKLKFINQN
ncbi:EamA family transporter, partial [Clostridium perfringens]